MKNAPIAVVGAGALFPGSLDVAGFWNNILARKDNVTDVPRTHWLIDDYYDADPKAADKTYAKRGAFLSEVPFDAMGFGVPPSILPATDTSQLLALIVAKMVLEDASRGEMGKLDTSRISVILGVTGGQELLGSMVSRLQRPIWERALRQTGLPEDDVKAACDRIAAQYTPWQESTFPGLLGNVVAGRIANRLNLGGTNCITDAACASALAAVHLAVNELRLGQSDMVVTGGVDTLNDVFMYMCFSKTPALSPTGDCRPFDESGDGTLLGEGIGMVALKRLDDAERDGDHVYAVLRGLGTSSDGRSKSVYAPVPEGQARAIRGAYEQAGYAPGTVELVEAHGTATKAGDAAELRGLELVFGGSEAAAHPAEASSPRRQACALGSIKSQIGHTKAAAGAAGLLKIVLALHHKVLPPTIKVNKPTSSVDWAESFFYLNTEARPWIRGAEHPRRASVSSFGFGGSNFHIACEEYTGAAPGPARFDAPSGELLVFTANTLDELVATLVAAKGSSLVALARATQLAYDHRAPHRLAVQVTGELDATLDAAGEVARVGNAHVRGGIWFVPGAEAGKVAFLYPGQGSQAVGMGADLAMAEDAVREALDAAETTLPGLARVMYPPPRFTDDDRARDDAMLTRTEWAQPALGALEAGLHSLLGAFGLHPDVTAGHSFGELTALYAAGTFDLGTLLLAARKRGELMAHASSIPGAMVAVFAGPGDVEPCLEAGVVIANLNAPDQTVIAGETNAVAATQARLEADGLRCARLPVATAFHSPLVAGAGASFTTWLEGRAIVPPSRPVYSNTTALPHEGQGLAAALGEHLRSPVRFAPQIEAMFAAGVRTFIEVGPGSTLTGLVGRCLKGKPHHAFSILNGGRDGRLALQAALGRAVALGLPVRFAAAWERRAVPAPSLDAPKMAVPICGTNYGKPYPPPEGDVVPPNPPRALTRTDVSHPLPPELRSTAPAEAEAPPPNPQESDVMIQEPPYGASPWVAAFIDSQRQTAEVQERFQASMAEAHMTFLRSQEETTRALVAMMTGQPMAAAPLSPPPMVYQRPSALPARAPVSSAAYTLPPAPLPVPVPVPAAPPAASAYAVVPVAAPVPSPFHTAPTAASRLNGNGHAPVNGHAPADGQTNGHGHGHGHVKEPAERDLEALLLSVVADKTGYPSEMLKLEMNLEADLGIDSIKRVEILSAMREAAPELPEVAADKMAGLKTLGQIVQFLKGDNGRSAAANAPFDVTGGAPSPSVAKLTAERSVVRLMPVARGASVPVGPLAVIGDTEGLAARLAARGIDAIACSMDELDGTRGVVFLGGLARPASEEQAIAIDKLAFRCAQRAALGVAWVTVTRFGGDFGIGGAESRAEAMLAALAGLTKTVALEDPAGFVRHVDLGEGADLADEIGQAGPVEIGLGPTGRVTLAARPTPLAYREPSLGPDDVIVVSGGARGVTASCLIALASACRPTFVLLGRSRIDAPEPAACATARDEAALKKALFAADKTLSPASVGKQVAAILAAREARANIAELERLGSKVRYAAVDVQDADAVRAALAGAGTITGIVHGAGVIHDKRLVDKTLAQLDAVFDTKVRGLSALLEATAGAPLRVICLFSSVAGRGGNIGQSDYAMANEVLNKVAAFEARARPGCVVKAIGWGPWEGGMVTPALEKQFRALGIPLLPVDAGARSFVAELADVSTSAAAVELVIGGGDGAPRPSHVELRRVHAHDHPFLADHQLAGTPVFPVVLALEWFTEVVRSLRPARRLVALTNLKVLKGIALHDHAKDGQLLEVHATETSPDRLALELRTPGGPTHYRATAELGHGEAIAPAAPRLEALEAYDRRADQVYEDGLLFHGPSFQGLRAIHGPSTDGMRAGIVGARDLGWHVEGLHTDPAAMDVGLQLAVLWTRHHTGGASLPTAIGAYRPYAVPSPGPMTCTLASVKVGTHNTRSNLVFTDSRGGVFAELTDVEIHALPSGHWPSPEARA